MEIRRRSPSSPIVFENFALQVPMADAEPRNILEKIVWHKEKEIDRLRDRRPFLELKAQVARHAPPVRDFLAALRSSPTEPAVIAEVKKASPSKGVIREDFDPVAIAAAYQQGGATCLSVLTDEKFFQGSFYNLQQIRNAVELPLLCKEFVIYPYQIYLARLNGADAVLLIAALLSDRDLGYFVKIARALGMTPLVEVHTLAELDRVLAIEAIELIGINNRNLENFTVDLQTTEELLAARRDLLQAKLVVSESGLHAAADLQRVKAAGARAVLIGESLVRQDDPAAGLQKLLAI